MTGTAAPDISQLQELAVTAPPFSYLPQTWGWALLAVVLVVAGAALYWRRRTRWQHDRYRREALARLALIEQHIDDPQQRIDAVRELPELVKRVALSIPGGQSTASLRGEQWQAFLQRHVSRPLPKDFAAQLAGLAYQPSERLARLTSSQLHELLKVCRHWIEAHHVAA